VTFPSGFKFKKGEKFFIHFEGLLTNPEQWIEPKKFIPERFDPKSKYYLTPSGKKRNFASYSPFFGGERVCFGKPIADGLSKIVIPYILMTFNFEFVGKSPNFNGTYIDIAMI
jgi:cytochrome P450